MPAAETQPKSSSPSRISFRPLSSALGVEAVGFDPEVPFSAVDFAALRQALHRHSLLLIRCVNFDATGLARFAAGFGPLERFAPMQPRSKEHAERYLCREAPDISRIGNLRINGKPAAAHSNGITNWHIDNLYKTAPHEATALYAVRTPAKGGDTLFAGLRAAYDALDSETKVEIDPLRCTYSVERLYALVYGDNPGSTPLKPETVATHPPAVHPLVRVHPVTDRKGLLLGPEIMSHIEGMDDETARCLAERLKAHALRPEFRYRHKWKSGDFLIFDNFSTLHAATEFDAERDQRLLYRAMVSTVR